MKSSIRDLRIAAARTHSLASAIVAVSILAIFVPWLRRVRLVETRGRTFL